MPNLLHDYRSHGLVPIPLAPRSKRPLVRWKPDDWVGTDTDLGPYLSRPDLNWGIRCDPHFVVLDFDAEADYHRFMASCNLPPGCPIVKTGRGFHIWLRVKQRIRSFNLPAIGIEVKAVGNYGEIYDRHLGPNTPLGLDRGVNNLWTKGGIVYAPPFR